MEKNKIYCSQKSLQELLKEGIIYIKPVYVRDLGLITEVATEKSTVYLNKKVKTIIKNICWSFMVDYRALKYKSSDILCQKYAIPLCIHEDVSLMPFKMVKPFGDDSSQGYINFSYISSINETSSKEQNKISIITLKNGICINVYTSKRTCIKHYRDCSMLMLMRYGTIRSELSCNKYHFMI